MSEAQRIAFRSGRQVGKTTTTAIKAIHHAINGNNRQVLILSPTMRQSSLMFRKIRAYCQHPMIKEKIVSESQTMIIFDNHSEIHSLPGNNPDTVRGFSPTLLIIDEAAFVKDDVYVAVEPSLAATNGQMILISTPFGKRGRFYQAFGDDTFEKYHVRSIDSPLITESFLSGQISSKTELEYKQEYEGEFLEEQDTYFPRELVLNCIQEYEMTDGPRDHCNYYLGVDCARYGLDETVYIIVELGIEGIAKVMFTHATAKKPLTDIIGRVKSLHEKWDFSGIYIDSSGLGGGAVDSLIGAGLPIKNIKIGRDPAKYADSVQFTIINKEEIYKNLKLLMEQGKIYFPKIDKLIHQLCELQYEFTEAGHLKLHHPENGHDDWPDSLALAVSSLIRPRYEPYIAR